MNKADMLAEIEKYNEIPRRQPGDVTLKEIGEALGLGRKSTQVRADRMVKAGLLTRHRVLDGQYWPWVYRSVSSSLPEV